MEKPDSSRDEVGFVAFSNPELDTLPEVGEGDTVICPQCGLTHPLKGATQVAPFDENVPPPSLLLFYECGAELYLGGVRGRLVARLLRAEVGDAGA